MSLTPQGPGWWQASDHLWYPPEQKPGAGTSRIVSSPGPVGPAPWRSDPQFSTPAPVQQQTTSGSAIASLVLSIVWLAGIGSLLGIIFGFSARGDIRRSGGRTSGDGLAIAGIIIGLVGLVSAGIFWVSFFTVANNFKNIINGGSFPITTIPTTVLKMGQPSPPYSGLEGGRITVYSIQIGVSSQDPSMPLPPAGQNFAVIRVRECAGPRGIKSPAGGLSTIGFRLVLPNDGNSALINYPDFVQKPVFDESNIQVLKPNACAVGYVGFALTSDAVSAVQWQEPNGVFSWTVPSTQFG
jgi:hypothetical protein